MYVRQHLELYRSIRRIHKQLPPALRFMGNKYVRDEWSRHRQVLKDAGSSASAVGSQASALVGSPESQQWLGNFIQEWTRYLDTMKEQVDAAARWEKPQPEFGVNMNSKLLDSMNDQQIGQLHALKTEALSPTKKN
ncbi:acetate non-utilizing protein 9 [Podochytrium sp. JEL0797]|nr:acetate non-utilizing protein 9 [Podochytrium sp. JEL0797]